VYFRRSARIRWAKEVAIPEIARMADRGDFTDSYPLIRQAQQVIPTDLALNKLLRDISITGAVRTTPPGANVYLKAYGDPAGEWLFIASHRSRTTCFRSDTTVGELRRADSGQWRMRLA
jgi:hypothetical protein